MIQTTSPIDFFVSVNDPRVERPQNKNAKVSSMEVKGHRKKAGWDNAPLLYALKSFDIIKNKMHQPRTNYASGFQISDFFRNFAT